MTDLVGVAAIIAAGGVVLVNGYAQYNTRRAVWEAKQAALDAKAAIGDVAVKVDGHSDRQIAKIDALTQEVARLQNPDATTPTKAEDPHAPVTLGAGGVPRVEADMQRRSDDSL